MWNLRFNFRQRLTYAASQKKSFQTSVIRQEDLDEGDDFPGHRNRTFEKYNCEAMSSSILIRRSMWLISHSQGPTEETYELGACINSVPHQDYISIKQILAKS